MQYEAITRSIRVRVTPQFLEDQSDPDDGRYFWAYTIEITNDGRETVQLRSRYWHITDDTGHVEEVRGPGVVGETPVLTPGASFTYTSGCPLSTASGIMVGHFTFTTGAGESFDAAVPAFSLDSPHARRAVH